MDLHHFDLASAQAFAISTGLTLAEHLLAAVAIFFFGRLIASVLARALTHMLNRRGTDRTLVAFLRNLIYALMLVFVVMAALERLGVNITSFAAMVAAAGLAIGLALQGSLSNFASGVMIIMFKYFRVGDIIEAGGQTGIVEDIQIFSTQLRTADTTKIILPNSAITAAAIKVLPPVKAV